MHRRLSIGSAAAALLFAAVVLLSPVRAAQAETVIINSADFIDSINDPGVTEIVVMANVTTTSDLTVRSGVSIKLGAFTWTIASGIAAINGSVSGSVAVNAGATVFVGGSVTSVSGLGTVYVPASNLGGAAAIPGLVSAGDGTAEWELVTYNGSYWCAPSNAALTVASVTAGGDTPVTYRSVGGVWERVYTITYRTGSGTNSAGNPTSFTVSDLPLTLKVAVPSAAQTAQGITFLYWSGGGVTVTAANASVLPAGTASDQVLTAVWGQPVSGGSGSMSGSLGGYSLGGYSLGSGSGSSSGTATDTDDETAAGDTAADDTSTTQTVRVRQARSTTQVAFANGTAADMDAPTAESIQKNDFPWGWAAAGAAALCIAGAALYAHKHRDDDFEEE